MCFAILAALAGLHSILPLSVPVEALAFLAVLPALLQDSRLFLWITAVIASAAVFIVPLLTGEIASSGMAAVGLAGVWVTTAILTVQNRNPLPARSFRSLLDNTDFLFVELDPKGTILFINRTACEKLGCTESEAVGKNWFEQFIPSTHKGQVALVHSLNTGTEGTFIERFENPVQTLGGNVIRVAWRNTLVRDAGGRIVTIRCSGIDITGRQKTEDELARSQADLGRYQAELQNSFKKLEDYKYALDEAAIVAITDARGAITYVNDRFCDISGYSREELLGRDHRLLNSAFHPKEFMHGLWETIRTGGVWRGVIRNRRKNGAFYWVATTIVPFLDSSGEPYQYIAIRYDITGEIAAQESRKEAERKLREQETLARLGEMSAVVAHEVKNPLAAISGALQIIGGRLPDGSQDRTVIRNILERIDALHETMTDLLEYARPRQPKFQPVPLLMLLRDTARMLGEDGDFRSLAVTIDGDDVTVKADPELLRGVFLNLFLNAAQAMKGEGNLAVSVRTEGGGVRIDVTDTGPGIPAEVRERMFDPFFTTKNRGTGLGLPTARRSVETHGGTLTVSSEPGRGTTMTVRLPV